MKSVEQLQKLKINPFYKMSKEEIQALEEAESQASQKKGKMSSRGNAAVKETGKLDKHSSDPVAE
jgi:hypothetical protein